jgi:phosphomannomutase
MLKGKFSFLKFLMTVVMVLAIVTEICEIKASAEDIKSSEIEVIYLFDMDGTLTPSRQPMTEKFAKWFYDFINKNETYIVTGSDIGKIKDQIPENIYEKIGGIYASMGNELYKKGKIVYRRDFKPKKSLLKHLEAYRKNTKYPGQLYPNYIEKRCGMINFCVLGRDCPNEARVEYGKWDAVNGERLEIQKELTKLFKELDIVIGGAISIDIVPKGFGKEQVADRVRKTYPKSLIVFVGDRTEEGGNDYSLAQRLLQLGNSEVIAVKDPEDTIKCLENYMTKRK